MMLVSLFLEDFERERTSFLRNIVKEERRILSGEECWRECDGGARTVLCVYLRLFKGFRRGSESGVIMTPVESRLLLRWGWSDLILAASGAAFSSQL